MAILLFGKTGKCRVVAGCTRNKVFFPIIHSIQLFSTNSPIHNFIIVFCSLSIEYSRSAVESFEHALVLRTCSVFFFRQLL